MEYNKITDPKFNITVNITVTVEKSDVYKDSEGVYKKRYECSSLEDHLMNIMESELESKFKKHTYSENSLTVELDGEKDIDYINEMLLVSKEYCSHHKVPEHSLVLFSTPLTSYELYIDEDGEIELPSITGIQFMAKITPIIPLLDSLGRPVDSKYGEIYKRKTNDALYIELCRNQGKGIDIFSGVEIPYYDNNQLNIF